MEKIKNLDNYNKSMQKALQDKLWFNRYLYNAIDDYDITTVYDFGCGDGSLIGALAVVYPELKFVGIDNSEEMILEAMKKKTFPNEEYIEYKDFIKYRNLLVKNNSILIMSSVFHEICSYEKDAVKYIQSILSLINPKIIFFRDMFNENNNLKPKLTDVQAICKSENIWQYQRQIFELVNSNLLDNESILVEFLLKYRYKENWHREFNERYVGYPLKYIKECFKGYTIFYKEIYTLPFLKQQVKKDFGIDLEYPTHIKLGFIRNF